MSEAAQFRTGPPARPDSGDAMVVLAAIGNVSLVGREPEQRLVSARLADAAHAPGGVVLISGEPGVGKTRLANATAAGPDRTVVLLRCDEHLRDVPYSPFLNPIDGPGELSALLTVPSSPTQSPAPRLEKLEQIHHLLVRHAEENTCVLVVDQLEWIDAASVDLLRHLVRRSGGGGRVLLATMRVGAAPIDSPLGHLLTDWNRERILLDVPLGPLGRSESGALVEHLLGSVTSGLQEAIYARTDGLPFFIEEFVRQLITEGHVRRAGGMWTSADAAVQGIGRMPFGIAANILRQLDHLPPDVSDTLRAASVLGTRCSLGLLAALVDCPEAELVDVLAPAVAMRLFKLESGEGRESPSHGSFTHALVRDGLYATLPREHRQRLHGRAADILVRSATAWPITRLASPDAALVAHHAERAHAWRLAYDASLAAGDAAMTILAGQDALVHFRRARGFVSAGRMTVDSTTLLALDYRLVSTLRGIGRLEESAIAAREMAARAAAAGDGTAESWALIQAAGADTFSDRFQEVEAELEQGMALADGLGNDGLVATALATRGVLSSARGLLDEADADFHQAIPLAEHAGNQEIVLKGMTYAGLTASWRGRYREAIAQGERALQLAESMHDAAAIADARFSLALSLGGCGEYEDALVALHHLLDLAKTSGEPFYAARVPNTIGWIYRELGLVEQALPWDERACAEPDDYGGICHFKARANSLINVGMDQILLGNLDHAEAALNQAEVAVRTSDYLRWRSENRLTLTRGELALAHGDAVRALDLATGGLAQATLTQSAKHEHQAHDLAGRALMALGRHEDAVIRLEQAVAMAREIDYLAGSWRSLAHLATALTLIGQRDRASQRYAEARSIVFTLAGRLRRTKLRRDFLAAPEVLALLHSAESSPLPLPFGLSEREREVLVLVVEGLTNTQIAARLFISPKTVSSHLVSIFSKLGVTSRASATRVALEHGLA